MKKGATPELDSKWWSKNKAKTMKKSGLGAELKSYEVLKAKAELSGQSDAEVAEAYAKTLKQLKAVKT